MTETERAINALEMSLSLMLFDPTTGETCAIEQLNEDNQELYRATELAVRALSAPTEVRATEALPDYEPRRPRKLREAATPMIDFLYEYGCPHSYVIVTQTSAELVQGECVVPFAPRD